MEDGARNIMVHVTATRRGFTLIELMIVIAIISILAAILIPNFMHARAESVTSSCEMNEKMLATAVEEYSVDNAGAYPTLATLTTPYLTTVPTDPVKKGNAYGINTTVSATYGSYEVYDAGGHDSTTLTSVIQEGTSSPCSTCTTVLWDQNSGVRGN